MEVKDVVRQFNYFKVKKYKTFSQNFKKIFFKILNMTAANLQKMILFFNGKKKLTFWTGRAQKICPQIHFWRIFTLTSSLVLLTEACRAVGHKGHIILMNQISPDEIRNSIFLPQMILFLPLMKKNPGYVSDF